MRTLREMKNEGLVVRVTPEVWGALMVVAGAIAAFVVLALTRQ
jgi:hypothetical protein